MDDKKLLAVIAELRQIDWFSNVGKMDGFDRNWCRVETHKDAQKAIKSIKWENYSLEFRNSMFRIQGPNLAKSFNYGDDEGMRYCNDFNADMSVIDQELERYVYPVFLPKWESVFNGVGVRVCDRTSQKELKLYCIEYVFDQFMEGAPMFFRDFIMPAYRAGHVPVGWTGEQLKNGFEGRNWSDLPDGQLMVY